MKDKHGIVYERTRESWGRRGQVKKAFLREEHVSSNW